MPDNPSKLQNVQLPTQPSDGLPSGIVEPDSPNGGAIDGGTVAGAAEQNVERSWCDCENAMVVVDGLNYITCDYLWHQVPKNVRCRVREGDLP